MNVKPKILMVCPWLDHTSFSKGMVFREQARVLNDNFFFTFISFQKIGIKDLIRFPKLVRLSIFFDSVANENYIYVHYLNSSYLGDFWNAWIEKKAAKKASRFFLKRKENFDLIHSQCLIDSGVFGYLLGKELNLPYIITEHAQINLVGISVKRHKFLQKVLNFAQKRLLVSRHKMVQYATARLYGEFEVVGNMVDESNFHFCAKHPESASFRIITVGAYTPIKDQITLLRALKLLDDMLLPRQLEFHWAGINGWTMGKDSEVRDLIASLAFKQVKFIQTGTLSRKEMASAYRESDLFVFSSLAEGMPLAVMEALACGLPVISTRWGGVEEIVHQDNGKIVELRDFTKLSQEIITVMESPNFFNRRQISENALAQFGSKTFREKLEKIYRQVLNESEEK